MRRIARWTSKPGHVEKVPQHVDQSTKTYGAREVGGNRGRGWSDCFDVNGSSQQTTRLTWVATTLKLPRASSHMQDATPTPANRTWEPWSKVWMENWELQPNLKTFSTRASPREFDERLRKIAKKLGAEFKKFVEIAEVEFCTG
jgi:hypothetical protein